MVSMVVSRSVARQCTDIEIAEVGIVGADLVEAHVRDELLEVERIPGEQRDAPLPRVEPDGAGDDLRPRARRSGAR